MPVNLTKIRFTVQARPYEQAITGSATCKIPAGSTSCTVDLTQAITNGTTGYIHTAYEVRSTTESTFFMPLWENIAWHTKGPQLLATTTMMRPTFFRYSSTSQETDGISMPLN
jgi:hypothetical protein